MCSKWRGHRQDSDGASKPKWTGKAELTKAEGFVQNQLLQGLGQGKCCGPTKKHMPKAKSGGHVQGAWAPTQAPKRQG